MSIIAIGKTCPQCGTLTACSGQASDGELFGRCGCCAASVVAVNPSPVGMPTVAGLPEHGACCQCGTDAAPAATAAAIDEGFGEVPPTPSDDEQPYEGPADGKE